MLSKELGNARFLSLKTSQGPFGPSEAYKAVQDTTLYLTTSAARSAAKVTTSVCGVPVPLDAEERDCAFMPVNFVRKLGKWAKSLVSCHDEVSENACSSRSQTFVQKREIDCKIPGIERSFNSTKLRLLPNLLLACATKSASSRLSIFPILSLRSCSGSVGPPFFGVALRCLFRPFNRPWVSFSCESTFRFPLRSWRASLAVIPPTNSF